MAEVFYFAFANLLLYALYTVFGMTLLPASMRQDDKKPFSFLLAPLLGAAVWVVLSPSWLFAHHAWVLPSRLLIAAIWCGIRWKTLFLPKTKTPYLVLAIVFAFSVAISRIIYPFEINGGLYFSFSVYDHVRCAIVNSIANFGMPPVNPWLADGGEPVALFYYFGWYAWAAQLTELVNVPALFAECCMTGFSAMVVLAGLTGIAGLCGLGQKKYGIAAFVFSLMFIASSAKIVHRILPKKLLAIVDPDTFIGFWPNIDNLVWSPHHMFSGAVVVLLLFGYFKLLGAETKSEKYYLAILIGILSASAFFTSVYAGGFALLYAAFAALILYLGCVEFRRKVNRAILPHLLIIIVFILLSYHFFRYLTLVEAEKSPLVFGMMPGYQVWSGAFRWIRYLLALYCFRLPNYLGLFFPLGMISCLTPRILPKNGIMNFFRIFVLVSLLSITVVHSSFYSNDFGWRTFTAPAYILSLFSAFLLVKFIDWFCAGGRGRMIFGCGALALLIAFECLISPDCAPYIGLRKTYPELRPQFARSIKGWDVVHKYTKKSDLVQCNPKSFYELGMLYEIKEYSTNIFFSLYSRRATAIGDLIFSKCYSEYYPQEKLQRRYDRVCRIFDGNPKEGEIAYLADELKIKAVLVTPYDGIWKNPGAIRKYYPHLVETPDYRVYLVPDRCP